MTSSDRLEQVLALLRAGGGRITSPRRAILSALIDHGGHPTAEQLTADVQSRQPDVHESTVYRFLDELERLGVVDHVHLGHGPAVYHFADDPHHHLVCDGCGVVVEVPVKTLEEFQRRVRRDLEFEMELRHFALPGRCGACVGPARAGAAGGAGS
ncbi:MAG TPA: transcriptional repressor [Acidimicrobiales bacterium]|nr:transcriptional repressor [Acidimicrobiales bacterium]